MGNKNQKKEEVILLSPKKLGYIDRGMVKWQGFLLSDHVEAMKLQKEQEKWIHPSRREHLTLETITIRLFEAHHYHLPVSIQLNSIEEGQFSADKVGYIMGYQQETIYIETPMDTIELNLTDIRHVQVLTPEDYQKILINRKDDFYG